MSEAKFVNLHVHTYYSILDGLSSPETYVKKAKEFIRKFGDRN